MCSSTLSEFLEYCKFYDNVNYLTSTSLQYFDIGAAAVLFDVVGFCRCVKFTLPTIPDFETLFVQTQEFISSCNGEQVRYATDSCKYHSENCAELLTALLKKKCFRLNRHKP